MRVFLASPYHSGSHALWAEGYVEQSRHEIHLATMPGSFWQWRLLGGFVTLAEQIDRLAAEHGRPDVILCTSLVDVAGLRGLLAVDLRDVPIALYMHENQITYPPLGRNRTERAYGVINWTSLLAADTVAFNSEFHRSTLLEALPAFLRDSPDERHLHRIDEVDAKAVVLPVGCDLGSLEIGPKQDPPLIVWNHRWDPDKDPGAFLRMVGAIDDLEFEVALLGERFVDQRPEHDAAVDALGARVVVDGHLDRDAYRAVLARATIVVSSAHQEFFGVSVVEAMAAGALPVLPRRLVYSERIPRDVQDWCLYGSEEEAVYLLRRALFDVDEARAVGMRLRTGVMPYDWSGVAPAYDAWLESTAAS
jgi:glycosyltransferase involved in cell wall biosynthesis